MKPSTALLALALWSLARPADASTLPAIDHTGHTLALGSGGTQGAGMAIDLAIAPRWRLGLEAGNANFTHLNAFMGIRGAYLLSDPGARLATAITGGAWGWASGPVIRNDGTTYTETRVDRYSLGLSWAYAFTPELIGRLNMSNLSDVLRFDALPWNLFILPFYGQDTGVELGYRINPNLELTVGFNTAFNQLLGVSLLF